jgi:hypothetical protein
MAIITNELFLLKDIEIKKLEKLLSQVTVLYSRAADPDNFFPDPGDFIVWIRLFK